MRILLVLFSLCFTVLANAQVVVSFTPDTTSIRIGEPITAELLVKVPVKSTVKWPAFADTITSHVEIIRKEKIDTTIMSNGTEYLLKQKWLITSFDSGYWPVPPLKIALLPDTIKTYESEAFLINVSTVTVDTTQEIKDIKAPLEIPYTLKEFLPIIGGGLLLAIVIYGIIQLIVKKKKVPVKTEPLIPEISSFERAWRDLELLQKKQLLESGMEKEYYIELSGIIRKYVESKYRVVTLERTSEEILQSLKPLLSENHRIALRKILVQSDLVKFAKEQPHFNQHVEILEISKEFLRSTEF